MRGGSEVSSVFVGEGETYRTMYGLSILKKWCVHASVGGGGGDGD